MTPKTMFDLKAGQTLWDHGSRNSVKGLHLRAFAEKKVFYLYYRTKAGVQRRPKVGDYGAIDLIGARMIAHKWLLEVASGGDPSLDTHTLRLEKSIGSLFNLVWEQHWSKNKNASKHAYEVNRIYHAHIAPFFSGVKISELKASHVREWHSHFHHCPYAGNMALKVLSKMMSFAEERELRPQGTNPCALVKHFMEKARERYATQDELSAIMEVLRNTWATHPLDTTFIYLLIYTGARPSAIEKALWKNVAADGHSVMVDGKTGQERIELSSLAIRALTEIDHITRPNPDTLTGIKFPRKFWERIRKKAGCEDLWARDLRRTFATVGMGAGLHMSSISELLNHKSTQTTKIYAKLDPKNREAAANAVGDALTEILKTPRTHKS